jgi:hypothetical protein
MQVWAFPIVSRFVGFNKLEDKVLIAAIHAEYINPSITL